MSLTDEKWRKLARRAGVRQRTTGASVVIKEISLKSLLAKATPGNLHPETDWGCPTGKEILTARGSFRTPTGCYKKAQGNALGKWVKKYDQP